MNNCKACLARMNPQADRRVLGEDGYRYVPEDLCSRCRRISDTLTSDDTVFTHDIDYRTQTPLGNGCFVTKNMGGSDDS